MEITDPEGFERYRALVPATIERYGGRYLARGGRIEPVEGDWTPKGIVILEFPSLERARDWHDSEEYAEARGIRQRAANTRLIIVEGGSTRDRRLRAEACRASRMPDGNRPYGPPRRGRR